ncbi:MAG: prohibitin family protein [Chiayiivirga sp.]|jgi:prohibitin 2|uniref:prohibitin family protein n=1 Tax=Chiayiivirga sp. TaxID=2041042 RepID=UPI0025C3A857|nr:prohibitin family protein [Chiayiivirga sp.]MCI1711158.1 prohibitin family protein [Chiayiivirga sp.]MCI1728045.1 prohibitin family protein [Chiayiivirga sp.]
MSLRRIDAAMGATRSGMPRWIFALLVLLGAVIAVSVLSPVATVPNGHRGVMLTFGKASVEPLNEGLHFRIPIAQTLYRMPVQVQRSETESEAASKDLQRVTTQVVLNYHVEPTRAVEVYQHLGAFENIEPRIIDPAIQEAMKAVTARFTAEQLVTKRPEVSSDIREAVHGRLERHGLIVDEFSITNFRFSESFDHAIEAKTVAEQQKLKAERDLERIKVEAEQRIEQARAEAESQKLNAQAQAEALKLQREAITPELIELRKVEAQLRAIEKWNGQMPNVTSGAVPFISVDPAR